jgi:signal transduction histidine kinase
LESGTTELNIRQVNLTEVVKDTLTAVQSLAKKREIQLTAEGLEEVAWLEGDATRLR